MNTKESIIENSLNLFSINGYEAVSIRDIAKSVGIKGSSIYNHFRNKKAIFNSVIDIYTNYVKDTISRMHKVCFEYYVNSTSNISDEIFIQTYMTIFSFLLTDTYNIKLRKLLTIEKFKNKKASMLFESLYIDNILNFQKNFFKQLIINKIMSNIDPYILALQLYSPVFILFYKNEQLTDYDYNTLKEHLLYFKKCYLIRG